MKNGNLVQHLKWVELEERPSNLGRGMGSSQMPLSPIRNLSPTRRDFTPPGLRGRSIIPEDTAIHREWDLFRFMHEIAKGMEYLHGEGVLHGDLKGENVLVDDKYRCVINDFGQSEMNSEVYRISGSPPSRKF
jgi:serine/threonine protein kinase